MYKNIYICTLFNPNTGLWLSLIILRQVWKILIYEMYIPQKFFFLEPKKKKLLMIIIFFCNTKSLFKLISKSSRVRNQSVISTRNFYYPWTLGAKKNCFVSSGYILNLFSKNKFKQTTIKLKILTLIWRFSIEVFCYHSRTVTTFLPNKNLTVVWFFFFLNYKILIGNKSTDSSKKNHTTAEPLQ